MNKCPKCDNKIKLDIIKIILKNRQQVICEMCDSKLDYSKKTNIINALITFIPVLIYTVFYYEINLFLSTIIDNETLIYFIVIIILATWGWVMYNIPFPWTRYRIIE